MLRRLGVVKRITAIGKTYFPEVTASATLINAPAGVETLWRGVSVFLNAAMRAKVRIVGRDYREALTDTRRSTTTIYSLRGSAARRRTRRCRCPSPRARARAWSRSSW